MNLKKHLIVLSAICISSALLAGCSSPSGQEESANMQAPSSSTEAASSAAASSDAIEVNDVAASSSASQDAAASSSRQVESSASSSASSAAEADQALPTIGDESANGAQVSITNALGSDITGIAVRATGTEEYDENLIGEGAVFADGDQVLAYLPEITPEAPEGSDVELRPTADIRITTADGAEYEIHQIAPGNIKDASIKLSDDGIAYIEYTDIDTGEATSTLESERAWIEQQAADAAAAENAQAPAEAAPAEAAPAEEQYYEEPAYQEPAYQEPQYQEPVYYDGGAGGGGAGGDQEACVPDIILR